MMCVWWKLRRNSRSDFLTKTTTMRKINNTIIITKNSSIIPHISLHRTPITTSPINPRSTTLIKVYNSLHIFIACPNNIISINYTTSQTTTNNNNIHPHDPHQTRQKTTHQPPPFNPPPQHLAHNTSLNLVQSLWKLHHIPHQQRV